MRLRPVVACVLLVPFLSQCAGGGSLFDLFGGSGRGASPRQISTTTSDARAAAGLVSQYRAANGLSAVTADANLNRAAEVQARAVAEAGTLSHGQFASRMASFGVNGNSAENLEAGSRSVGEAIARWKASSGHNRNLLMPEARRIGLARALTPGAGYEHYWVLVLAD